MEVYRCVGVQCMRSSPPSSGRVGALRLPPGGGAAGGAVGRLPGGAEAARRSHQPLHRGGVCVLCYCTSTFRVATGQGKVREICREICAGPGKFEILIKVREIQENPLKVGEI